MMKRITVNLPPALAEALAHYQREQGLPSLSAALVDLARQALDIDVPLPRWGDGLRFRLATLYIHVANGRAQVARTEGGRTVPATNWETLEDEAIDEIARQGGSPTRSGIYKCPAKLAGKATFEEK